MTTAVREFKSTALTPAFFFGAVIFPMLIWGVMFAVSAIKFEKPPLEGTLVIVDETNNQVISKALQAHFDPAMQELQAKVARETVDRLAKQQAQRTGMAEADVKRGIDLAVGMSGITNPALVTIEVLQEPFDEAAYRHKARDNEILALVKVDEATLQLNPDALFGGSPVPASDEGDDERAAPKQTRIEGPGTYEFVQGTKLRPDHADQLRAAVTKAAKDQRYIRANMDPTMVGVLSQLPIQARSVIVTESGEKDSNEVITRILPFIFLMLIYIAAITGGQYLMMGTLEEKSSRVMEVVLSACSARELLIGKLLGQGLVGLAVLTIYAAVGAGIASRFGALAHIPPHLLPWMIYYFLLAYFFIGALMLAVGSAVTEIREAQALYTPITICIILPFLLIVPIMQNPGSLVARIFSFFPPTTPYVMVMRMSQPSHVIPVWELIATAVVGLAGVVFTVWAAAKIFRVGVLMYGKPPSLGGLIKWVGQA